MPFDVKYEAKGIISRGYSCFKIIENFKKLRKFRKKCKNTMLSMVLTKTSANWKALELSFLISSYILVLRYNLYIISKT